MTQLNDLVDFMTENGSVTTIQASRQLGVTQLAARIGELEQRGYRITRSRIKVNDRHGNKKSVVAYSLGAREEQ